MQRILFLAMTIGTIAVLILWQTGSDDPHAGHASGKALAEVTVPELSETAQRGRDTFNASCATCHGTDGAGVDGAGPPLVHIIYEPNHHADITFYMAVQRGVRAHHWRFGDMPAINGVSDTEIAMIISYIRELQRANGIF